MIYFIPTNTVIEIDLKRGDRYKLIDRYSSQCTVFAKRMPQALLLPPPPVTSHLTGCSDSQPQHSTYTVLRKVSSDVLIKSYILFSFPEESGIVHLLSLTNYVASQDTAMSIYPFLHLSLSAFENPFCSFIFSARIFPESYYPCFLCRIFLSDLLPASSSHCVLCASQILTYQLSLNFIPGIGCTRVHYM